MHFSRRPNYGLRYIRPISAISAIYVLEMSDIEGLSAWKNLLIYGGLKAYHCSHHFYCNAEEAK